MDESKGLPSVIEERREELSAVVLIASSAADYDDKMWTPEAALFAVTLAECGCERTAVRHSGYTLLRGRRLRQTQAFRLVFNELLNGDIEFIGQALAIRTIKEVMTDSGASAAARVQASKLMREWGSEAKKADKVSQKHLQDMGLDELTALVQKLEQQALLDSKTIDITPELPS